MVPASSLGRTSLGDQGTWSSSINPGAKVAHLCLWQQTNLVCEGEGGNALIEPWFHFCFLKCWLLPYWQLSLSLSAECYWDRFQSSSPLTLSTREWFGNMPLWGYKLHNFYFGEFRDFWSMEGKDTLSFWLKRINENLGILNSSGLLTMWLS